MKGLFTELNGNVTKEQIEKINKTGVVPSDAKSPEEKEYLVIFKSYLVALKSQIAENEMDITGEAIIIRGRYNMFQKIKEYLDEDAEETIDLRTSMVMVEGVDAAKAVSLYRFILLCNKAYPDEQIPENITNHYLEGFNDEDEVKQSAQNATGSGNFSGTLLRED